MDDLMPSSRPFMVFSVQVVDTAPTVQGWKGEDIRLPCHFESEPQAVVWVKESISRQQPRTIKADFRDGIFDSLEERFDIDTDFSLVITDLKVADEGLYICQVVLKNFDTVENTKVFTVSSMASKHIIEECVDESQSHQSPCAYQPPSDSPSITLTCVVTGFKPNISMLWTEKSGERLNSVVSQQKMLSDDTYERLETINISANQGTEKTFICMATGDSLNGTSTAEITLLYFPGNGNNVGLICGLGLGVTFVLLMAFLLLGKFLQKNYPNYLPRQESLTGNSLTDEQIRQCKHDLKVYYRKTRRKITVDPLNFVERVNLDEIYTNLSLIDKSSMRRTPITYEDLLTNDDIGNLSKRLLIQGEGGVGKTTLCAKIAWDWCQEKILQDLDMVIVIPLRDVTVEKTIGGIVERYLSDSNEATSAQIDDYISTNLNKVLLIFDGFDEFSGKIKGKSSSEVIRILGLEQYESCKVIVTSRPWRTDEFRLYKSLAMAYTFISVEGFNKENLSEYIRKYFRIRDRDALAETLLNFMDENDVLRNNMAPFPIFCAMLCLMWNDVSEERRKELQKLQTFSEIFREMITSLKEHYAAKFCENLQTQNNIDEAFQEASRAIQDISATALDGILEKRLSFPEKQFRMCHDAMETCCKVGVLTIEKDIDRKSRHDTNIPSSFVVSIVSFPHKLFQEYIAGIHIATLFETNRPTYIKVKKKLIRQYKEFRYLLYFASAVKKELGLDIMDGLIKKDDLHFCLDVAFECHTEEAARAVGKRWEDFKLSPDMSEHTKAGVVFMGNCDQAETLLINDVSCGKTVSRYLAEGMCSSSVLRKVALENTQLHPTFYTIMGKEASNCKIQDLELLFQRLDDGSQHLSSIWEDLTKWIFTMPRLSNFIMTCPFLDGIFFSKAAASASACQIQDLTLNFESWHDGSQQQSSMGDDLAQLVCIMPSLSSFSLNCPYLNCQFLSKASASASSCQIQDLKLVFDSWDDGSKHQSSMADDLAKWVFAMQSLSSFNLHCYYLDGDFLAKATAAASSSQIRNLTLTIDDFKFYSKSAPSASKDMAQWVCTMPRLSSFSVKCCYLLSDDFFSTAAKLAQSSQIQDMTLVVGDDNFYGKHEPSAAQDLAQWMCAMPCLSSFSVKYFYLLDDDFFSTAAKLAKSCQICKLSMEFKWGWRSNSTSSAANFARFLCHMPHLERVDIKCLDLPKMFFTGMTSQPSICKIEAITINGKPLNECLSNKKGFPLRSTVDYIGSIGYNTSRSLADILSSVVGKTDHHVFNSKDLAEEFKDITLEEHEVLVSFDVVSLFTNTLINQSIQIVKDRLQKDSELHKRTNLSLDDIIKLLEFILSTTYFSFDGKIYRQKYGAAMGSHVSPIVANIYMEYLKKEAIASAHDDIKPRVWKRYVDGILAIVKADPVDRLKAHLDQVDDTGSIKFIHELEVDNSIPFLDTKITKRPDGTIKMVVYRKKTHTGQYLNFKSHHPLHRKLGVIRTLRDSAHSIVTEEADQKAEEDYIQSSLRKCGYPGWSFKNAKRKREDNQTKKSSQTKPTDQSS
ncbi:uncharacterized protein [Diadema setosum]|uniref:uncharacterized protein n=1 Tax=Diadema setosum TaxID=31175 RepID=UPI003B3B5AA4